MLEALLNVFYDRDDMSSNTIRVFQYPLATSVKSSMRILPSESSTPSLLPDLVLLLFQLQVLATHMLFLPIPQERTQRESVGLQLIVLVVY